MLLLWLIVWMGFRAPMHPVWFAVLVVLLILDSDRVMSR